MSIPEGEWYCESCENNAAEHELSEYEQLRADNIQKNEERLRSLGLLN